MYARVWREPAESARGIVAARGRVPARASAGERGEQGRGTSDGRRCRWKCGACSAERRRRQRRDRARAARPTSAPRIDRRHPPPPGGRPPPTVFLSRPGDAPDFFRDIFSFATRSVRFHYGFEFDLSPRRLEIFLRWNLVSNVHLLISID